jgi:uroporphyrinogen decarboxylase
VNHRERALRTFRYQPTDRVPYDLMENILWPALEDWFRCEHGLQDKWQILDFLDTDFRWVQGRYLGPPLIPVPEGLPEGWTYSDHVIKRPLADAQTVADIEAYRWPDPANWDLGDFAAARSRWPDHALVFLPDWAPLFGGACDVFGIEEALVKMISQPQVFEAFVVNQHAFYMQLLARGLQQAKGLVDICWLGDDYASQRGMLMNPRLWRRLIKPFLAEEVAFVHQHGMFVLFHSCGAVRPILPDLVDIGIDGLLVFQTRATGMDAMSIARDFGGHMVFYGGIDVQQLLSYGTPDEVGAEVRANVAAFEHCGGYIVANSHNGMPDIRGENVVAMCKAARACGHDL